MRSRASPGARRTELAESYVDHIVIALKAEDRGAPFRTFIDNWYAFHTGVGHLTRSDRPIWFNNPCARAQQRALRAMHFVSSSAQAVLDTAHGDPFTYKSARAAKDVSVRLMVDHTVPLRVIIEMMFEPRFQPTRENVLEHLERWYRLGVLTAAEDAVLNRAGLRSRMPVHWNRDDPFARYSIVGIV